MESSPPERAPATPAGSARPKRRVASVVAAGTIALVTASTGAVLAVASSTATPEFGGAAARYVPADGHLEWVLDNAGALRSAESARSVGYAELLRLPALAANPLLDDLGTDAVRIAQFWRETSTTVSGGSPGQTTDLHRLSDEGLTLVAGFGGATGFSYSPALLELPADVAPGSSWHSAGDALPNGIMTYTAQYTASAPSNEQLIEASRLTRAELGECLQTDGGSTYRDSSGAVLLDIVETDLWCAGRGRVAIVATVNGSPVVQGPLSKAEPGTSPHLDVAAEPPAPVAWSSPGDWTVGEAPSGYHDTFFGDQPLSVALANPPVRTASGLIVSANQTGDDLTAQRLDSGTFVRQWFAHPGGEILGMAAVGDVTVAATSRRQVVAYSGAGIRLWTRDVPELVLATPVDATTGAGERVVVAGLDGTVLLLDALTGDPVWERKLAADVSLPPLVAGSRIIVADRAGHLTAFRASDGEVAWSRDGEPAVATLAIGPVAMFAGEDGYLRAYDAASGAELWSFRYTGMVRAAVAVAGTVVLATDEHTVALDRSSGRQLWVRGPATDAVTDREALVVFEDATATLVDSSGKDLAQWPVPSLTTAIYRYALAGADGILVFRSNQPVTIVGAP